MPGIEKALGGTVLLLTEIFHRPGGMQNYNRDQVQAILKCKPEQPLSILVLNDAPEEVRQPEWDHCTVKAFRKGKVQFAAAAYRAVREQRPHRTILGHRNYLPLAPILKAAFPRSEIWLLTYGIDALPLLSITESAMCRFVDKTIAISPATGKHFRDAGFTGEIALWPCSLPFFWKMPVPVTPRFQEPHKLLSVSRLAALERYKGIDDVIQAVHLLTQDGVPLEYHVVGDGDDRDRLTAMAQELTPPGVVIFHGRVGDEELKALYSSTDLFVLPSGGEGFGIVFLEAMAYGKPVIGAGAAAPPYVVRPGESGYLVPFNNPVELAKCIRTCIDDPQAATAVGRQGRVFLDRNFSFDVFVNRATILLAEEKS